MSVTVVDHPLAAALLTQLRDRATAPPVFRTLSKRLALAIALEAIRDLPTTAVEVDGPLERTTGVVVDDLVAVPILRAGLGMLEAVTELFPEVAVGYIGLERDEASLRPQSYYRKLPPVEGRHVLVLDPMLATGGTLSAAIQFLVDRGADHITAICLLSAPEGCDRLAKELDGLDIPVTVVTAAMDERLNDKGYIVPGLGDAGDRLYGVVG